MTENKKKRKLGNFVELEKTSKNERVINHIRTLKEKGYTLENLLFEVDGKGELTGLAQCRGKCAKSNKEFTVRGGRMAISLDRITQHTKTNHGTDQTSEAEKTDATKQTKFSSEVTKKIQRLNARIIGQFSIQKNFFNEDLLKQRDRLIIQELGGSLETAKKLSTSGYLVEQEWRRSAHEMRTFIKTHSSKLIECGYMGLSFDHKFLQDSTGGIINKVFGLLLSVTFAEKSKSYLLALEPARNASTAESIEMTDGVLADLAQIMQSDEDNVQLDEFTESAIENFELGNTSLSAFSIIPIVCDAMCLGTAKHFSPVFQTCLSHTLNNVLKGSVEKAEKHFGLPKMEIKNLLTVVSHARKGITKKEMANKGISDDKPSSFYEFQFHRTPDDEEKMEIFKLKNPDVSELTEDQTKQMKKIDRFPVPERLNLIRFAQLDRHLTFLLASEKTIKDVSRFSSEDSYLLEDAPQISWDFVKSLKKITGPIKSLIKISESNLTSGIDSVFIMEDLACRFIKELDGIDDKKAEDKYYRILLEGAFTKIFLMIFKKIKIDGEEIAGREHDRFHPSLMACMLLFWERQKVTLYKLVNAMKKSKSDFIRSNIEIAEQRMACWKEKGKKLVFEIHQKLNVKDCEAVNDSEQDLFPSDDEDIDPALLQDNVDKMKISQGAPTESSLEMELRRYENITLADWRATKSKLNAKKNGHFRQTKIGYSQSELMLFFWKSNEREYPFLSKIGVFLSKISCSSSEMERVFGTMSRDCRDPQKNRQLIETIELRRQFSMAEDFKELSLAALKFENLIK